MQESSKQGCTAVRPLQSLSGFAAGSHCVRRRHRNCCTHQCMYVYTCTTFNIMNTVTVTYNLLKDIIIMFMYTVAVHHSGSSITLPVSLCLLLDAGRGHCAVHASCQSVHHCP